MNGGVPLVGANSGVTSTSSETKCVTGMKRNELRLIVIEDKE
jgi:hypothetical protein